MKCEIESAANFLSSILKIHSVLTPEQLERFKEAIETHLEDYYQHHWFPDRPTKGSGYRCIRINHKLDPILSKAGQSCGIDSSALRNIFPNELTLWIDPDEVCYRIGENGSICVLFDGRGTNDNDLHNKSHKKSSSLGDSPNNKKIPNGMSVNKSQVTATRSNSGGRGSPTDSTLSSSTSTMSSPSPSSSPDWNHPDRHSSPDNWSKTNGHGQCIIERTRTSPVSLMGGGPFGSSGVSGLEGVGLFGPFGPHTTTVGHHAPFAFSPNVISASGHHSNRGHHHQQQLPQQPHHQQVHFNPGYLGFPSPFRGWIFLLLLRPFVV